MNILHDIFISDPKFTFLRVLHGYRSMKDINFPKNINPGAQITCPGAQNFSGQHAAIGFKLSPQGGTDISALISMINQQQVHAYRKFVRFNSAC